MTTIKIYFRNHSLMLLWLLALLSSSCKKNKDSDDPYFISFLANGEKVEFKGESNLSAEFQFTTNIYTANITAITDPANMSLQLYSSREIKPGTYSGYSYNSGMLTGAVIGYSPDGIIIYLSETELSDDPTIIITELDDDIIKGSFEGTIKSAGQMDIEITQGEFQVKITDQ